MTLSLPHPYSAEQDDDGHGGWTFVFRAGRPARRSPAGPRDLELARGLQPRQLGKAATDELPRVRAMLGAAGEQLGMDDRLLKRLRASLNPLSRYDFGTLTVLRAADRWQAKRR
jgi:hypothetical protein